MTLVLSLCIRGEYLKMDLIEIWPGHLCTIPVVLGTVFSAPAQARSLEADSLITAGTASLNIVSIRDIKLRSRCVR